MPNCQKKSVAVSYCLTFQRWPAVQSEDLKSRFHDTRGIMRSGPVINPGSFSFEDSSLSSLDPRTPGCLPQETSWASESKVRGKEWD